MERDETTRVFAYSWGRHPERVLIQSFPESEVTFTEIRGSKYSEIVDAADYTVVYYGKAKPFVYRVYEGDRQDYIMDIDVNNVTHDLISHATEVVKKLEELSNKKGLTIYMC